MCGIAGMLNLNRDRAAHPQVLEAMLQSIFHRGPDEDGRLIDNELAMGMRRLSIIDLADGQQPIYDESGRYGIVFNGEIYNYRELREDLIARGHTLKTHSDTETIVHLFEESGPACVDQLRGMFAFAIWDHHERKLFIARDRMGIKPLYYTVADGTFVFGSEIKALREHPAVHSDLDKAALSQYLSLKYVPAPRTLFEGIRSLPPGHSITLGGRDAVKSIQSADQIPIQQYWDIRFQEPASDGIANQHEYVERLEALLRESVKLRLRADVPFGAFLSGGLDSSTIVALMAAEMDTPVKTFSVGFGGPNDKDELPYANEVAQQFGCEHHTLKITADDFMRHAEDVLWHLDQPIADQATIATHMVASLARKHVKMVLTGEGGDELFAGYARYGGEHLASLFDWVPGRVAGWARSAADRLPGLRRQKIALNALTIRDEATRFANWFPMFNDDMKAQLLTESMRAYGGGAGPIFRRHLANCSAKSPINRMLYVDSKMWLPDYLLLRGDKLTMANSLEARVPLLDHKLVEFAATVPANLKLNNGTRKYLLKKVAGKLLPDRIINRKKQGFPIPIENWLRTIARPMMRDLLSTETLERRGLFDTAYVQQLMSRHESGYADHATELWGLMSVEMWMQRFVDSSNGSGSTGITGSANTLGQLPNDRPSQKVRV